MQCGYHSSPFKVVVVGTEPFKVARIHRQASPCVYSSETSIWNDLSSTSFQSSNPTSPSVWHYLALLTRLVFPRYLPFTHPSAFFSHFAPTNYALLVICAPKLFIHIFVMKGIFVIIHSKMIGYICVLAKSAKYCETEEYFPLPVPWLGILFTGCFLYGGWHP